MKYLQRVRCDQDQGKELKQCVAESRKWDQDKLRIASFDDAMQIMKVSRLQSNGPRSSTPYETDFMDSRQVLPDENRHDGLQQRGEFPQGWIPPKKSWGSWGMKPGKLVFSQRGVKHCQSLVGPIDAYDLNIGCLFNSKRFHPVLQ